jgi:prepilin-type N-terminal cleavage/methylation domain-containing protein
MGHKRQGLRGQGGYSLAEMMVVVGIIAVLGGISVLQYVVALPSMKGDGAMRVIMGQIRLAQQLAISERRYMRVTFTSPNQIQIVREEIPGPTTTVRSQSVLEGGLQYSLVVAVPDTPDQFGNHTSLDFGSASNVKFSPDGTLVNQDGATTNGTVFVAIPTIPRSARAITILGSTGRVRAYRWNGAIWNLV